MSKEEEQEHPTITEKTTTVTGNIEISYVFVPLSAKVKSGVVEEILPDPNNIESDDILSEEYLTFIDMLKLNAIKDFFRKINVKVDGTPWTSRDQEDYPGQFYISRSDLNQALINKKIVIRSEGDFFIIENLDDEIDKYVHNHWQDEAYDNIDE